MGTELVRDFPKSAMNCFETGRGASIAMPNYRDIAYALLRVTMGVIFLFYGIEKFRNGIGSVADGMEKLLEGKLPLVLVRPFAYLLPFVEVIIGALLTFGLFSEIALILAGLLMLALTFGTVMIPDRPTVVNNATFAFIIFVLSWLGENNSYSLDGLRRRRHM